MSMSFAEQKRAAKAFVARWKALACVEEEHSRSFWIELLQDVYGLKNATHALEFERKVKGRKIDVFYEDMGVLVEMKGRGIGLDEASVRSKKAGLETPYQQAKWYADNLPFSIRPRWIVTCNFDEFRIYDQEKEHQEEYVALSLDELPEQLHLLGFLTDANNSRIEREKQLSVQAGELVGKLYTQLSRQYKNIETDAHEQRSLNVLIVRLVFLLYAEDSGLLHEKDAVLNYLKDYRADQMRQAMIDLFRVLDTPLDERDPYLPEGLLAFPYVNGGLFGNDDIVVPQFTEDIRLDLLLEASQKFDWSGISPTIFGAAFESTLNPATRRAGGMHYTSIENIHKVIDPLFLDDLRAELAEIEGEKVEKNRTIKLKRFQKKLGSLRIFDPACGSGNFLTESYLSLRRLENRVIESLQGDQMGMSFGGETSPIEVSIDQFYGIEINDFAVSVAKTALWIAEEQMMEETSEILLQPFDFLPLKSNGNIHQGNALRMDWNDVLPAEKCNFIVGNPPFLGAKIMTSEQKKEIVDLFGKKVKLVGSLDYVSGWYVKASEMMSINSRIRTAFVSTNSICQGQQVFPIWNTLEGRYGIAIDFAHRSFVWNSEASDQAHVHVVIVGFSIGSNSGKKIFVDGEGFEARSINAYLCDAPDVKVSTAASPICVSAPSCDYGSLINDGGHYIFKPDELDAFLAEEPGALKFVRPLVGSEELIKGKKRFVLYLRDVSARDLDEMPLVSARIEAVRKQRSASSAAATRKTAATPEKFYFDSTTDRSFLVIPSVSSERRKYVPMAICEPDVVATNLVSIVPDAGLYHFGVLMSRAHNAWMRTVAGRMKSDYRYSSKTVYNTFVWPGVTRETLDVPVEEAVAPEVRARIESCAQAVLDARAAHEGKTLADLYDPDAMPMDLRCAHQALDAAVEAAYGVSFDGDEERIVAHLFELYAQLAG